jgi:GDP-L-fucose synthase
MGFNFSLKDRRILVTGGAGFVGRGLVEKLKAKGAAEVFVPRRKDYDLTTESGVRRVYEDARPEVVFHLAAEVGGIGANQAHPGRFFFANLAMGLLLIEEGRRRGLARFVQVGTICAYPKFAPLPFREADLWNGYPEETNAPYGIAKKALLQMLQAYRAEYGFDGVYVLPVNLYGPGDNFHPQSSHVIPALIRKMVEAAEAGAPEVEIWGTGKASREFLYVDDCAEALVLAGERLGDSEPVNLGTGSEVSVAELAAKVAAACGYTGALRFNPSKPDGQPRRCLDTSRAAERMGFRARTGLDEGLARTVAWYREQRALGGVREVVYGA